MALAFRGTAWRGDWIDGKLWIYRGTREAKQAVKKSQEIPKRYVLCVLEPDGNHILVTAAEGDNRAWMVRQELRGRESPWYNKRKCFKVETLRDDWPKLVVFSKKIWEKCEAIRLEVASIKNKEERLEQYNVLRDSRLTKREKKSMEWKD